MEYEKEENGNYFNNFVKECIKDLKKGKDTFCFTKEQIKEIRKKILDLKVIEIENGFYFKLSR